MTLAVAAPVAAPRWIRSRWQDTALAWCWVPFAAAAMAIGGGSRLTALATGVFLLSGAHQPLTLALVYGDRSQFRVRPILFTVAPLVLALLVVTAIEVSVLALAIVGGLWNTEHTLMQRYGITRIHARKAGRSDRGRLELALLASWLVVVLSWAAADPRTPERVEQLGMTGTNGQAVETLASARPYALAGVALAGAVAAVFTARWFRCEMRSGFDAGAGYYGYLAGTAALFATAAIHPVAGFLGWVGSHAIEYFLIVHGSLGSRYRPEAESGAAVARAVNSRAGRTGAMAIYLAAVLAALVIAERGLDVRHYAVILFTVGGLHILYDGVIWKLRRPDVARSFGV